MASRFKAAPSRSRLWRRYSRRGSPRGRRPAGASMYPPPAKDSSLARASLRTSSGLPRGRVLWLPRPPPKAEVLPEFAAAALRVHGLGLEGVDDLHAYIHEVGQDIGDVAAGVDAYDQPRVARRAVDARIAFFVDAPPLLGPYHEAILEAPIVAEADRVAAQARQLPRDRAGKIGQSLGELFNEGLVARDVAQVILEAAEVPAVLEEPVCPSPR